VRSNQLIGYGLVVGLDGTGDQTTQVPFTTQGLTSMLQQMGITVPAGTNMQLKNVAAVMVTAELPPFAQPGQTIDVTVSSVGNAKSLRGGTLIATPLKGADGEVYAVAQGNLIVGGAGASSGGSKVQINHLSGGRVPQGATVERTVPTPLQMGDMLQLDLNAADFATARAVANAINTAKGAGTAQALDGRVVRVRAARAGPARVLPGRHRGPAAGAGPSGRQGGAQPAHRLHRAQPGRAAGALRRGARQPDRHHQPDPAGQPAGPLSNGQTAVTQKTDITVQQQGGSLVQLPAGAQLADVVKALNSLGATPQDLLAILQAMKAAGALQAELEVI
jgi:flagellar P-ring protein precursor FlgI